VDNTRAVTTRMRRVDTFAFLLMQSTAEHTDYKLLYEQSQATIALLTHHLDQLRKMIFASRSERFVPAANGGADIQLSLDLAADTIAQCNITDATTVTYIRAKTTLIDNPPKAHPGRVCNCPHTADAFNCPV
jgi:transposase